MEDYFCHFSSEDEAINPEPEFKNIKRKLENKLYGLDHLRALAIILVFLFPLLYS
jgi:hypothetical protein